MKVVYLNGIRPFPPLALMQTVAGSHRARTAAARCTHLAPAHTPIAGNVKYRRDDTHGCK